MSKVRWLFLQSRSVCKDKEECKVLGLLLSVCVWWVEMFCCLFSTIISSSFTRHTHTHCTVMMEVCSVTIYFSVCVSLIFICDRCGREINTLIHKWVSAASAWFSCFVFSSAVFKATCDAACQDGDAWNMIILLIMLSQWHAWCASLCLHREEPGSLHSPTWIQLSNPVMKVNTAALIHWGHPKGSIRGQDKG